MSVDLDELFSVFIGNTNPVTSAKIDIEGARRSGVNLSHMLLTGGAGVGKTTLCRLIAQAMDAVFLDMDCSSLEGKTMEEILFQSGLVPTSLTMGQYDMMAHKTIILWDEAHRLDKKQQSALLKPMLDGVMTLRDGTKMSVRNITHIFATTDSDMLITPLKDRCEAHIHLDRYTDDELAQIISKFKVECQEDVNGVMVRRWYNIRFSAGVNQVIAERAKHTPRLALNMVKRYYRFLRSQTNSPAEAVALSSSEQLQRYFQVNSIGIKGLRRRDWQYLQLLSESSKPLGASLLASQLEVSDQEVKNEIEPHLRFSKLIETGKSGRAITKAGRLLLEEYLTPTKP